MEETKIVAAILAAAIIVRHKPAEEDIPIGTDFVCDTYKSCLDALRSRAQTEADF